MSTVSSALPRAAAQDEDAVAAIMHRGGVSLRERMRRIEQHLEQVTSQAGVPLAVHAAATVAAGGKRLRPLLVVLACEAAGGPRADGGPGADGGPRANMIEGLEGDGEQALVRAAVAVELVHSATLVHDDVIDGAELRRGHPTVVAGAGRGTAIATGDLLFSRAFAELARNGDLAQLRALSDASSALATGELLQREDAYAARVAVERYLRRCELKTAALFEAACRLGALIAGGGRAGGDDYAGRSSTGALADGLGAFARRIGLAFQLLDDVLDVSGPVERTGKTRGTDLLDGTVTLPLILARERDERLAALDLASLRGPDEAAELCDRIAATGALREARERALAFVADAKAALPELLPGERSALLDLVADAVVERYR
jgi:geranylgeranyl pyrophosphate synthase